MKTILCVKIIFRLSRMGNDAGHKDGVGQVVADNIHKWAVDSHRNFRITHLSDLTNFDTLVTGEPWGSVSVFETVGQRQIDSARSLMFFAVFSIAGV